LLSRFGRLAAGEAPELVVGCAVAERPERFALYALGDPAADEPDDGVVELLGRHALEDGARDRGGTVEAAAQVDVVGLPALPPLVAHGRPPAADPAHA